MDNWIVMPIRNCKALTQEAIKTCLAQDIGKIRILAMDDGSTDGVREWLQSQHSRGIETITRKDAGVTKLWNIALSHLFDVASAPYVLCVNNDVKLRPDAYKRLVADSGLFVTCVGNSSGAEWPGGEPSGSKRPHPDFSCFLIRRECWQKVGQFDESMRIYCSDGDMHLRMHKAGIEAYCLDLPFYHYASGTLKSAIPCDQKRIMAIAEQDRQAFEFKWGCKMGSPEYYSLFGAAS